MNQLTWEMTKPSRWGRGGRLQACEQAEHRLQRCGVGGLRDAMGVSAGVQSQGLRLVFS